MEHLSDLSTIRLSAGFFPRAAIHASLRRTHPVVVIKHRNAILSETLGSVGEPDGTKQTLLTVWTYHSLGQCRGYQDRRQTCLSALLSTYRRRAYKVVDIYSLILYFKRKAQSSWESGDMSSSHAS